MKINRVELKAVIFDMDGIIIDSEPLWAKAEQYIFSSVGVRLTKELCKQTACMTTKDVTDFWFKRFPWTNHSLESIENRVIDSVGDLIQTEGEAIEGIRDLVHKLKNKGLKIGLSTNSPERLIPLVLEKVGILTYFDAWSSAENERNGKPCPDVYLSTASKLGVDPKCCMAIEDSPSGIEAAKQAGMYVTSLICPNTSIEEYKLADQLIYNYTELTI